ncbi:MAG: glycine cleavage T C-terminal barrel domain-containing protein [Nitrospirota bacterium]
MTTPGLKEEYHALRAGAGLLDHSDRVRLRITGAERAKFLQGILTNDTALLSPGRGLYGAVLTAKGKMQADLTAYALPEWFWVDSEPELAAKLPALLSRYTIGSDAAVADISSTHGLLGLYGPEAPRTLGVAFPGLAVPTTDLAVTETTWNGHQLVIAEAGYPGTPGYKVLVPAGALEVARQALVAAGATAVGAEALDAVRIESGVPRFGADMSEENFPPEARIEARAVSYTKGCYMGQETIARIKTYGHVNRLLVGLLPETDQPIPHGTKLYHPDVTSVLRENKEAGYVTSSVYSPALKRIIALGYVNRKVEAPGTIVTIGQDAAVHATVTALPFV